MGRMGGIPHVACCHWRIRRLTLLEDLTPQPEDPILAMMDRFRNDPRADKIDLGIGIYRNSDGITPVMRAVKLAEHQLLNQQSSKSYTSLSGDPAFVHALATLVLSDKADLSCIAGAGTVGGTGAIRQGLDLIRLARPDATVHIPDPSWPNHKAIIQAVGLTCETYRYFDAQTGALDMEGLVCDLRDVPKDDVVLLHGCCHNPTGADPNSQRWGDIIQALQASGATVVIDFAYLGLGDGLDEDAAATRRILRDIPETIIAISCSKNFGLYRDRAGAVLVNAKTPEHAKIVQGNLSTLNRLAYSFPADHGAKVAEMILNDAELRAEWINELAEMRNRINDLRKTLANALLAQSNSERFALLGAPRGMFSRLNATPDQIKPLREDHGIYLIGDGRMNIAGLSLDDIPRLARAIATVCV